MNRALVNSSKYSPGNLPPATLQALFVARHDLLESTLEDIADSIESKQSRFILLVGPRGAGKTHFTSLLHHRIESDDALSEARKNCQIVFFNEEEWGIASYLDFLMRILEILSDANEELLSVAIEIRNVFDSAPGKAVALAEATLKSVLKERYLLLICENLNDIMQGLGLQGQKQWRSFIQEFPQWVVFAAAPKIGNEFQSQDKPFYGQFTIRYLNRLKIDEAIDLLVRKARLDGRSDLAEHLLTPTGRARVRAIHHLAGGNPRIYVVLSEFLTRESVEDLYEPFMQMADDLTPYYQDRLRQLAPRQRKIIEYLSRARLPEQIKEIADSCLLTHQSTSKQIHELAKQGFVTRIKIGRNTYCELSEPLMRICIEIKDNRTKEVRLFVEFLQHWFSNRELKSRYDRLANRKVTRESLTAMHLKQAVDNCHKHQPFLEALDAEGWECFDAENYAGLAVVKQRLVQERDEPEDYALFMFALRESDQHGEAVTVAEQAVEKFPNDAGVHFEAAVTYFETNDLNKARQCLGKSLELEPNDTRYLCLKGSILLGLGEFREVLANGERLLELDSGHLESLMDMSIAFEELGYTEKAIELAEKLVEIEPEKGEYWSRLAYCLMLGSRLDEALEAIQKANLAKTKYSRTWKIHGRILEKLGDYDAALKIYQKALKNDANDVAALCRLSGAHLSAGNHKKVLKYGKQLLSADPAHTHAYLDIGTAAFQLGKTSDGIVAFETLLENISRRDCDYLPCAFDVAVSEGHLDLAEKISRTALDFREDDPDFLTDHIQALVLLEKFNEAIKFSEQTNKRLGFVSAPFASLYVIAIASRDNLHAANSKLRELVDDLGSASDELDWETIVRAIIINEYDEQGPDGIFETIRSFADFKIPEVRSAIANALIFVSVSRSCCFNTRLKDWEYVLPKIKERLKELPECGLPVEFLQTAVRYVGHGDDEALLALPVELRDLLVQRTSEKNESNDNES